MVRRGAMSMSTQGPCTGHLAIGVVLAGLLLVACSGGSAGSSRSAPAPPAASAPGGGASPAAPGASTGAPPALEPAHVAYTTIAAVQAPFWIAQEAGYFREQGLDVPSMERIEPGATLLAALHNGDVDVVAAGGPSLILGTLQGLDTLIIGSQMNVLESVIVVRPELKTVEELRGKTVGVSRLKAISDVGARLGLERMGLKPDVDVFTRGTGGIAESLAALEQGSVEGASLAVPALFTAQKRGYPVLIDISAMKIPFAGATIGTTRATVDQRLPIVERALRAVSQGASRFKTDGAFAAQVVAKFTQIEDPEALRGTVEVYQPLFVVDPYPDLPAVQAALDVEDNPAARTAKPEDMVDLRPAERLRQSGFLDRLPK
jgi:NitT/TauT family transport system substrate-binding protein